MGATVPENPMALSKHFKSKLVRLLEEEELDLYVLSLHYRNDGDLNYFSEPDRRKVKSILDVLIQDTERHAGILKLIVGPDEG